MSLEQALADNTAAVKALTAALAAKGGSAPASTGSGKGKGKGVTEEEFVAKFGAYLTIKDKALRKERMEQVAAMLNHLGAKKVSDVGAEDYTRALGFLAQFEAGETPDFMNEDGDGGDDADSML